MTKEILVADPDKTDQEELQRIFESTDYRLVFSENGEEAILRVKLFRPDLIIAGAGLSERNGLELCEAIKADSEFKHIPVILLTGMFEEVSEKDRARVGADGVVSKPLREEEILSLVESLVEEKGIGGGKKEALKQERGWNSLSDLEKPRPQGKQGGILDGLEDEEEEIIDLVEVVEEAESKMSIDDFIAPAKTKAEPVGDVAPLESWDKLFEDEEKPDKEPLGTKPPEKPFEFSIEEEKEIGPPGDLRTETKESPEEELFEKIELEEILEKVEQLKSSIEKEWPSDAEIEKRVEEALPGPELETTEKWMEFRNFETALKTEVEGTERKLSGEAAGEGLAPFTLEEPKKEAKADDVKSMEEALAAFDFKEFVGEEKETPPFTPEREGQGFTLEEPKGEPAENLKPREEALAAFDFEEFVGKEKAKPFAPGKEVQPFSLEEPKEEGKAEDLKLTEEALGTFDFEEFLGEEKAKPFAPESEAQPFTLEDSEGEAGARPGESMFDEIQAFIRDELRKGAPLEEGPDLSKVSEVPPLKEASPAGEPVQPVRMDFEEEPLRELAEEEFPETLIEELEAGEIRGVEEPAEQERRGEAEAFHEEAPAGFPHGIGMEGPGFIERDQPSSLVHEALPSPAVSGEVGPEPRVFDQQLEGIIGKGVEEMMEGFITKVLPQMTQNILNLTADRIEKMVREILPDLAEKAIQEEIRRLQKEDKD
jgi:CheY-like chemotaxis protein